ncbi:hypothetical protein, partial [Paracoccus sp. (in: a-proteobacteria)]|uniref:hypothetical protein n=1 Tax=Paracoccus sp. TaxID=267 RepID=UPI0035AE7B22
EGNGTGWRTGVKYVGPGKVEILDSEIYAANPVDVNGAMELTVGRSLLVSEPQRRSLNKDQVEALKVALRSAAPGNEEQALRASSVGRWLEQQSFTAWASLAAAVAALIK